VTAWTIPSHRSRGLSPLRDRGVRRFWLRALLAPGVAWEWSRKAEKLYRDHGGDIHRSRVLSKPLHGYLRRRLSPAARLRFLLDHHRAIAALIERDALSTLWRGEALELVILQGRKDSRFRLYLANAMMEQTHRESELAIVLVREGDPTPLSRLTFNLVSLEGRLALAIGGLQGPSEGGKRMVIDATRSLYGLRPKDATLLAARALARALGANPVHAVSDALHVRGTLRNDPKICSYDAYWLERGARPCPTFGFAFPPLAAPAAGPSGRDGVKHAIVRAMETFVAERRGEDG
jgi:uncharacterized protein